MTSSPPPDDSSAAAQSGDLAAAAREATAPIHTRAYRGATLEAEDFPLADTSDWLAQAETFVWVDLESPDKALLDLLADELGLHELAVEDAVAPHQRPKLDHYDTHLFLSCHAVHLHPATGVLRETEINAFIGPRWFVTVRKGSDFAVEAMTQRWNRSPALAVHGVGFLLYGLLDEVVDGYFDAVDVCDQYYDDVSEFMLSERPLDVTQPQWFEMRQALIRLHRLSVPLREAVSGLMRRDSPTVSEPLYPYYQDVYDHILRVTESTDSLRDLVSTIVETTLSLRDYRQNQVVKKVSSWAAIVAVPALITGFYGMNVPYPGSGTPAGAIAASALIAGMSAALYFAFKRNDWL